MGTRKKSLPQKNQTEKDEKKISAIFDKAEQGDAESMMRVLMGSGRGYEMSEQDLSKILRNRRR